MFKLSGVLFVFTAFVLLGFYFSGILRRRVEIFRQTRMMIDKISTLIKYRSYNVFELCDEIKKDDSLYEMTFVSFSDVNGIPFSELWNESVKKWNVPIKNNERNIYSEIGKTLGTTDTEGQISSLMLFDAEIKKILSDAEKEYSEKSKLIKMLGVLSGAFVSIMIV